MEEVKYLRGGRGGGGTRGRKGAGGYAGALIGEGSGSGSGSGRGKGRGGRVYGGNRSNRGSKMKLDSIYKDSKNLDFTRKLQNSTEKTELDGLKNSLAVDCTNKEETDSNSFTVSEFRILPDKKYDGKTGMISSGVSSTEASEYCKSQSSSQNPSPAGCFQEKYDTDSNPYGNSKHSLGYKNKRNHQQITHKDRRAFNTTQTEKTFEIERKGFEKSNKTNHNSEEALYIQETASSGINKDTSELPASNKKNSDREKDRASLNQVLNKNSNCLEQPIENQNESNNSKCTYECTSNKLNPRIIVDVINWMVERQEEAIQWLKENGKYQQESNIKISVRKPNRLSQDEEYMGKKQACNGNYYHTKRKNHNFSHKYKNYKKNSPSYFSNAFVSPLNQDKNYNSTSKKIELSHHQENTESSGSNFPNVKFNQKPSSRPKHRSDHNRRFNRERDGNFQFQNRTKEELYHSTEVKSNSKWEEKKANRSNGSNSSTKYKDNHYRKQLAQK